MKTTLNLVLRSALVAVLGAGLGLAWNAVNPAGVRLTTEPLATSGNTGTGLFEDHFWDAEKNLPPRDRISVEAAYALFREGTLKAVDSRSAAEFAAMHIPAAHNVHDQYFERDISRHIEWLMLKPVAPPERAQFPEGYPIVVYCNHQYCDQGATMLTRLRGSGLINVRLLTRGFDSWLHQGYTVAVPARDERGRIKRDRYGEIEYVERSGDDIPRLSETGIAWLPAGLLFGLLLALPWLVLAALVPLVRKGPGFVGGGLNGMAFLLRLGLGLLFLYASYFKLTDPPGFAQMVLCYEILPLGMVPFVTVCLPAVEALAGALLVLGVGTRPASMLLLSLLVVFMVAVFSLMVRNMNCVCGCFPGDFTVSWTRVWEDSAFLLAALLVFWRGDRLLALKPSRSRRAR